MSFEINKVHHADWMTNGLPDKSVQLIIADPPYFEVKGEFDFVWASFEDYLKDVEKWALECERVLADNGTLFWYGMDRKIAYAQTIFDKHFELLGTLVWEKPSIANEWDTRRTFPERGQERILMYGIEEDYHDTIRRAIRLVQEYLSTLVGRDELAGLMLKAGICKNQASAKQNANNILSQKSAKPQLITRLQYSLIDKAKINYEELIDLYENGDENRRFFKNQFGLTDVLRFSRVYDATHPTQKPEDLTRSLILTCSRPGNLVLVPFAGSGTECAMSLKEGRNFIGFDINPKYVAMSSARIQKHLNEPRLPFDQVA